MGDQAGGGCRAHLAGIDIRSTPGYPEIAVKIARWGNSLAVRLPRNVADELSLKEGDEIQLRPAGDRCFEVVQDRRREEALARIREMSWPLPPDYQFDRDEIYDRFGPNVLGRVPYDD